MKQLAQAFVKAKKAFSPALKSSTNPHFKSKYADLGACLEAVNDALLEQGLAVYQETFEDSTGVTVETVFLHESGEALRCGKLHVPASKNDPQGYGSALTYARRYSLMAACGIAPEDDDGNAASKSAAGVKPTKITGQMVMGEHFDAMSDEEKAWFVEAANYVTATCKAGAVATAVDYINEQNFEQEQRLALESLLDSKTRSAIKAEQATRKAKATA